MMNNVKVFFYVLIVVAVAEFMWGCPIKPILGG